ncbi:MAG TPA: alpha/beta hydrolase family protein [Planctomycetota bacterium]|nr:alpha/beta hydrolase family protein [Planctomycetota bacterium]
MKTIAALLLGVLAMQDRPSFPDVKAPDYPVPTSLEEWKKRREETRKTLWKLLGDLPERPAKPEVATVSKEERDGYRVEKLAIDNGAGAKITSTLLVPKGPGPFPAILYLHWHAGQYALGKEELWQEAPGGGGVKRGEDLVKRGYVVLAPDAYAFGERSGLGPDGPKQKGGQEELTLSKTFLWMGRSLWGMMVRDDRIALDVLAARPEVDPRRIGATGISMGSTRTWWLAALDDRVAAAVGVCCLTRYQDLIAAGGLHQHGIYYFVPGILKHFDTEAVASLIAPRPFLTLSGADDKGSPAKGVETINAFCAGVWKLHGKPEDFKGILYPGVAHVYTPEMWREMTGWFERRLLSGK